MRKISQNHLPKNLQYDDIIERFLVDTQTDNFDSYRDTLITAASHFNSKISIPISLHEISQNKGQYSDIVKYYTDTLVNGDLRIVYDIIRASSSRCPHCSSSKVTCLDHYLPKEKFPLLAIYPKNLIPTCKDCNEAKGTYASSNYDTLLLNPYYDEIYSLKWISARITDYDPINIEFFVIENPIYKDEFKRVDTHFKKLKLQDTFQSSANDEISGILWHLKKLLSESDSSSVSAHLLDCAKSWEDNNINSWQRALYECLGNDSYFCNEYLTK
ncbi:TPA: hypothetical protein I8220_001009 [Aeromonas hydrophila]|uniref:hypothetical protein n=1 Tax=Aeromonas hydrophila TaxID=644 RepID=UPI001A186900|nr:hypothetical protein [Aeromonas hydrophila]MDE8810813.1 hypothetical protein [Aeromonas hydrophila]HAT2489646.1 hypothetical protein [Aeromonas hydrophila]HAT2494202.1 hypothetical protein [Aeromonas hydrophila]HAT2509848.1 hypothetical protein [Aeromonas hydrophila]HAT2530296.1 hypothetical protein [Aeromonas hydrophila]